MVVGKSRVLSRWQDFLVSIVLFLLAWQALSFWLNSSLLPSPLQVFVASFSLFSDGELVYHILASVRRTLIGFLLAVFFASITAYTIGLSRKIDRYLNPLLELLRPIPPLAWIPLAILWFGIGDGSSYFIIFIAAFFPILTNVYFGVRSIPVNYKRIRQNFSLSRVQNFIHVVFPFTTPYLLTGCKTSIGISWMAVIAAEMIAASKGLGYFIETGRVLLKTEQVIIGMIIIGFMGFCLHLLVTALEKRLTFWRFEKNG